MISFVQHTNDSTMASMVLNSDPKQKMVKLIFQGNLGKDQVRNLILDDCQWRGFKA